MVQGLAKAVRDGDGGALARALTVVESGGEEAAALLAALGASRAAWRVGVTGPPGVGKSTLVSALVASWRRAGRRVGVLAVDPSSPFTGGALLGDRVRMLAHHGDEGVFIRSLASRGSPGGLAEATEEAADLLDAAGFGVVLVETVGVGQGEIEVARIADAVVVVLAPGSGDAVQGMKAGLLEIADLVVVNQGDRDGAEALAQALDGALSLRAGGAPALFRTVATRGEGVDALRDAVEAFLSGAPGRLAARRRARARDRIRARVDRALRERWWNGREAALDEAAERVARGALTPAEAAAALLAEAQA
jgi:LAO/AO transport system kinase